MKNSVRIGLAGILALALGGSAMAQDDPGKVIIVLDASGSMWGQIEGKAKIDIAKETIEGLLASLDPKLELGLMAYGHRRKGDCDDIELLIPAGKVDRSKFLAVVQGILPKGKTPLAAAVEQAAQALAYTEAKSSVILVSDGLENCDGDLCAVAKKLEKTGVDFTAHVVAFDLSAKDARTMDCLPKETGGQFLAAQDAASLKDALEMVVQVVTAPPKEAPEEKLGEATLEAPAKVPAGKPFKVKWTGPANETDYITIVKKGTKDREYGNYTYTRRGNPLDLLALITPGPAEVRYVAAKSGKVLGRIDIEVEPISATVTGPAEVGEGSHFDVEWTGPANKGDYVTVVEKEAKEGSYTSYHYAQNGMPGKIRAPIGPGTYELRYVTGQKGLTLARSDIRVNKAAAAVKAPAEVIAGADFAVEWTGPGNQGDYITVVEKGSKSTLYKSYAYTKDKKGPVTITMGETPGEYEVRYVSGAGKAIMAMTPIVATIATTELKAVDEVQAGGVVSVSWTNAIHKRDFITIVMKSDREGKYQEYAYASAGSPKDLHAPETPGEGEIRYVTAKGNTTLARIPIRILPVSATLKVAATVPVKEKFRIEWTGPNNDRDYITIVPKGAPDRESGTYHYAKRGSPAELKAPEKPGEYELRYVTGKLRKVLARQPVMVTAE